MENAFEFKRISRKIKKVLLPIAEFALIYGSAATERFNEESDIDLAVYFRKIPTMEERIRLTVKLGILMNRDVDLIILNTSDIIITMQALANGNLILNKDPQFFYAFKAQKIGMYIDFKISRQKLEDNLTRGMKRA